MNRNQVKGAAKDISGKVERKVGEMTDNRSAQAKGAAKQVEGKVQKGVGNVQQAAQDAGLVGSPPQLLGGHGPLVFTALDGGPLSATFVTHRFR